MDFKLACLLVFLLGLVFQVEAEFFFNPDLPKPGELKGLGLKCVRGRTVIRIAKAPMIEPVNKTSDDINGRRSHMNMLTSDESCQICVCSAEGRDEYCSSRPARNVNECMRMAKITDDFNKNIAFDHERFISSAIRRDGANQGLVTPSCIPFLSEYNDCNDITDCRGCNKCTCDANGQWSCYNAFNSCSSEYEYGLASMDDDSMDGAINTLMYEIAKQKEKEPKPKILVPPPPKPRKPTTQPPAVLGYIIAVLR